MNLKISVIIPTYNGEHKISNVLCALEKQTYKDFELIVAIDGSVDHTEIIAQKFSNRFSKFKIINQPNKGRAAIRNYGAKNAFGDLLIFYDDDMIPFPDSVKQHMEFHLKNSNVLLAGNPIGDKEFHTTDFQRYLVWISKKWSSKYTDDITLLTPENIFFTAANCSIPRKIFDQLNGFDERLTDAEDFDYAYRALEKNIPVYFDQTNTAIHNDLHTCISYIKRIRQYRSAREKLYEIHPYMTSTHEKTTLLKHLIYRFFAFKKFSRMIDRPTVFMIFPVKIRYHLYSIIIQSLGVEYPEIGL